MSSFLTASQLREQLLADRQHTAAAVGAFTQCLDRGESIYINLAGQNSIGKKSAQTFGRLVVHSLFCAAESRKGTIFAHFIFDEAPVLFSRDIATGLAQIAKRNVALWLGMQWTAQAEDEVVLRAHSQEADLPSTFEEVKAQVSMRQAIDWPAHGHEG